MAHPDLPELVTKARHGDRLAFERLVSVTARIVYAQIVAAVRDRQKAEDLTQETFLAAWRSISDVDAPEGFTTWLLTVARRITLDSIKYENRRKRRAAPSVTMPRSMMGEAALEAMDRGPSPHDAAAHAEDRDHALRLLDELPDEYRRPLLLRFLGGADYDTIRRQLQISDGALRGLLSRGMALLRERMTPLKR